MLLSFHCFRFLLLILFKCFYNWFTYPASRLCITQGKNSSRGNNPIHSQLFIFCHSFYTQSKPSAYERLSHFRGIFLASRVTNWIFSFLVWDCPAGPIIRYPAFEPGIDSRMIFSVSGSIQTWSSVNPFKFGIYSRVGSEISGLSSHSHMNNPLFGS